MAEAAELVRRAARVLAANDLGEYTKPSPRLYPHQWNWDSAFIALGWAHLDWPRAAREIEGVLAGQWVTGMVPQIRYNPRVQEGYFPGQEWWPEVPVRRPEQRTSGIAQPLMLVPAAYELGLLQPDAGRRQSWWAEIYPALREAVLYFPRHRTVGDSPLIVVVHPWESGLDNSPRWDFATRAGHRPTRSYVRLDTTVVNLAARPPQRDYDLYVYLVEQLVAARYDLPAFLTRTPFAVYDALFNAIWYRAALDLNRLGAALGEAPAVSDGDLRRFQAAFHATLWHEAGQTFRDYDLRGHTQIPVDSVAGLIAIYGGLVDQGRAGRMLASYRRRCAGCRLLPSVPADEPGFEPGRYWRGPVWVNTNWLLIRGLEMLGLSEDAAALRRETLDLVAASGFFENFHAHTGAGLGSPDFSWTAALVIDLLIRSPRGIGGWRGR